jgi:hypothetical protein
MPLLVLAASLAVPVAAWAQPVDRGPKQNDGTLSILRGKGQVDLKARGAVIGEVRKGKVKVKVRGKRHRASQVDVRLLGKGTVRTKPDGTVVYKGKRIQIRIVDLRFRLQINGIGIHLSAVALGTCKLQASATASDPGLFSINDQEYRSLPDAATTYPLAAP